MSTARIVSAIVCALIGLVWLGQGLGLVKNSAMTGDIRWSGAGLVLIALAVWQLVVLIRMRNARR